LLPVPVDAGLLSVSIFFCLKMRKPAGELRGELRGDDVRRGLLT
jgi:hypothetical protein